MNKSTDIPQLPLLNGPESFERGYRAGAVFRAEGRDYGKVRSQYPSNPYHVSDPRSIEYDDGYEAGFCGA